MRGQELDGLGDADVRLGAEIVLGAVISAEAHQSELPGAEPDGIALQDRRETIVMEEDTAIDVWFLRGRHARQSERPDTLRGIDDRVEGAVLRLRAEAVGPGGAGIPAEPPRVAGALQWRVDRLHLGEPARVLIIQELEIAVDGVDPAAARRHQKQAAAPGARLAEVIG